LTKTFDTETEARDFAKLKFDSGLIVTVGTINPHLPRRAIPSAEIPAWLQSSQTPETKDGDDARGPTTRTDPSSPPVTSNRDDDEPCDE
jgi:hypothetical protein